LASASYQYIQSKEAGKHFSLVGLVSSKIHMHDSPKLYSAVLAELRTVKIERSKTALELSLTLYSLCVTHGRQVRTVIAPDGTVHTTTRTKLVLP